MPVVVKHSKGTYLTTGFVASTAVFASPVERPAGHVPPIYSSNAVAPSLQLAPSPPLF